MTDVGLSIVEGVANGASAQKDPSKRNIGLLGQFIRGAAFTPTKITSMEDFNVIFGGQSASFFGPGIVKSIFDEAGNAPVTMYLARVVGSEAVVANGVATLTNEATMNVSAGYKGVDDPGAWANGIKVSLYSFGSRTRGMFTLIVKYGDKQEQYNYATLAEIQTAVNKVSKYVTIEFSKEIDKQSFTSLTGSVTVTTSSKEIKGTATKFKSELKVGDTLYVHGGGKIGTVGSIASDTSLTLVSFALTSASSSQVDKLNNNVWAATLAGGADGTVTENDFYPVVSATNPKGLACFNGYDVQIIGCTEYHSLKMAKVLNEYLKERKGPIGIVNLPLNADEGTAELYANALQTSGVSYLAGAYLGWVKIPDNNGNAMLIPAMGPILGAAYVRTPYLQGDFIHIPPGGTDSLFNNVLEVIPARLEQSTINKLVQQLSCNIIQYAENIGYYVGSSRTYSTNALYCSVHIRLQTSYYVRALNSTMRFAEQKPNTPELKREMLVKLRQYFKTEYDNGALERSVDFDTAYQGICDNSNNPSGQDRKLINVDVLWIPTECTESIRLSLQRNDGVLNITESEA